MAEFSTKYKNHNKHFVERILWYTSTCMVKDRNCLAGLNLHLIRQCIFYLRVRKICKIKYYVYKKTSISQSLLFKLYLRLS